MPGHSNRLQLNALNHKIFVFITLEVFKILKSRDLGDQGKTCCTKPSAFIIGGFLYLYFLSHSNYW